ncbi:MAG: 2,4-dienoyl-CoA reductase (NADPH2) [Rugosibacter sp.]|nr:2,4-dienoyl-CoA reductase (NADPH2) [Rugosibacter sp.]
MQNAAYPMLFSPLKVGTQVLKNRAIMGSMHLRLETLDRPLQRQAMFYAERAREGVALMVTGGFAPCEQGLLEAGGPLLATPEHAHALRTITQAVHAAGGRILLQILHAGRYARLGSAVAPSAIASPIHRAHQDATPRELTADEIETLIEDFVNCAELAALAGFDGVEVMGSEGYLLNQFTVTRTNWRNDAWGGSAENRQRLPVEIVRRMRQRLGVDFLIMFRISALDLVEDGANAHEVIQLAQKIAAAGADILDTGIGWHEARVPTIAYVVPRAAWVFAAARIKRAVPIPVVASNRINTPEVAENVLASGGADMVSMARPFLADPAFLAKAQAGRADEINTCIACNQACLDYIFSGRPASCLVNPRAGRELTFSEIKPATNRYRVAIAGAGVAGLSCAVTAAEQGHEVILFEAADSIGGQINYARQIPTKQEFNELLRYYRRRLEVLGVRLQLNHRVTAGELLAAQFDRIVVATGVSPRVPEIPGIGHPSVASYVDVLSGRVVPGQRVVIIGAGGIGFDVAEFLCHTAGEEKSALSGAPEEIARFFAQWGVNASPDAQGGLQAVNALRPRRQVTLVQRKPGKPGRTLGLTTGWALKMGLQKYGVEMLVDCRYERIDGHGLHLTVNAQPQVLAADTIVLCAGQASERGLFADLTARGVMPALIGGAQEAGELDALRAIDQGMRCALALS